MGLWRRVGISLRWGLLIACIVLLRRSLVGIIRRRGRHRRSLLVTVALGTWTLSDPEHKTSTEEWVGIRMVVIATAVLLGWRWRRGTIPPVVARAWVSSHSRERELSWGWGAAEEGLSRAGGRDVRETNDQSVGAGLRVYRRVAKGRFSGVKMAESFDRDCAKQGG